MAALMGSTHCVKFHQNIVRFAIRQCKLRTNVCVNSLQHRRLLSSTEGRCTRQEQDSRDPGPTFMNREVQRILKRVAGLDVGKVFKTRLGKISNPSYKLVTGEELEELNKQTRKKAERFMQMPPVLKIRNEEAPVISEDSEINQFETDGTKYVFTDITFGIPVKDRTMVVREQDGTLRHASPSERDRYVDVYYPRGGKMYSVPKMFREGLEDLLAEHKYEYVLDRACVQFEPDEAEYVSVTQRVYEHVAEAKRFDDLRSTRHFGVMTFYFVFYKDIDALLLDMLERNLVDDAEDLVRLYHIVHPGCDSVKSVKSETDSLGLVKAYANSKDTQRSGEIQLCLQAILQSAINIATS